MFLFYNFLIYTTIQNKILILSVKIIKFCLLKLKTWNFYFNNIFLRILFIVCINNICKFSGIVMSAETKRLESVIVWFVENALERICCCVNYARELSILSVIFPIWQRLILFNQAKLLSPTIIYDCYILFLNNRLKWLLIY